MGIVIDFEEAKKKLFTPAEQSSSSDKLAAVKAAAEQFTFSRLPLRNRVFIVLKGVLDNQLVNYENATDDHLLAAVDQLLPYVEGKFLKPYVQPPKSELTVEIFDSPEKVDGAQPQAEE